MPFRRGGAGKRRDAIEPEIIKALVAAGFMVWQISGGSQPDLLTYGRRRWMPLGVKSGQKARLTPSEKAEPPQWPMVHDVEEALRAVGAII